MINKITWICKTCNEFYPYEPVVCNDCGTQFIANVTFKVREKKDSEISLYAGKGKEPVIIDELDLPFSNKDFLKLWEQASEGFIRKQPALSHWIAFDWNKPETRPTKYDKYLVCRKDGKIHWETWNGNGWAYNHNEIRYWAVIIPPNS